MSRKGLSGGSNGLSPGDWVWRLGARMASPGRHRGRLVVLIYHQVLAEADPLRPGAVTEAKFQWQMAALSRVFHVLPLAEAVTRLNAGTLPPGSACVTFDDGYRHTVDRVLPVLQANGLPATFFIATGVLGGCMWNDMVIEAVRAFPGQEVNAEALGLGRLAAANETERLTALRRILATLKTWPREERDQAATEFLVASGGHAPDGLMIDEEGIRNLRRGGMTVGAHTVTHPVLSRETPARARAEIAESRDHLEAILGEPVDLFAYPNGRPGFDYTDDHVRMVRDLGFRAAFSTERGGSPPSQDPYQVRRFTPWDHTPERFTGRLLLDCLRAGWR